MSSLRPVLFVSTGFCSPASLLTILFIFNGARDCFSIHCCRYRQPACQHLLAVREINPPVRVFHPLEISQTCYNTIKKRFVFLIFFNSIHKFCVMLLDITNFEVTARNGIDNPNNEMHNA